MITNEFINSNGCTGDYGSPVYYVERNDKNVITKSDLVGLMFGPTNARLQAPCKDGHKTVYAPLSAFMEFFNAAKSGCGVIAQCTPGAAFMPA